MSIIEIIIVTFLLMGFSVLGIAFWATWYPKILCQKIKDDDDIYNVCVKRKNHADVCMSADGKKFASRKKKNLSDRR
tara:strand:- start:5997 stop:6227 length:231 start_codon:yes stop_codon:yes gene_type:complete